MIHIVMFGPPGAGKGTQAALLKDRLHFAYIATGDIFRQHIKNQTELGKLARTYIDRGELVPDEVTIQMLKNEMDKHPGAPGIIFDGFPRTTVQAGALEDFLKSRGYQIDAVIALEVPEDELIKRILNRGKTSGRSDDAERSTVVKRLEQYRKLTEPLKDYYKKKGVLSVINGLQDIEAVHHDIVGALENLVRQ